MGATTGHGLGEQKLKISWEFLALAGSYFLWFEGYIPRIRHQPGARDPVDSYAGLRYFLSTTAHTIGPRNAGQQIAGRAFVCDL